jgi:acyl dehydratase
LPLALPKNEGKPKTMGTCCRSVETLTEDASAAPSTAARKASEAGTSLCTRCRRSKVKEDEEEEDDDCSYYVRYTTRDAILYALSLGFGANPECYNVDLPVVWEDHPAFAVFPTMAATFPFWGQPTACEDEMFAADTSLPTFPPPLMQRLGLLPEHCFRDAHTDRKHDLADYPILHTWQSFQWNRPLAAPPATCRLTNRFVKVVPKTVGTFVTTEMAVYSREGNNGPSCTIQSTALILGLDPESLQGWEGSTLLRAAPSGIPGHGPPDFAIKVPIATNQALLYRLASGDTNAIHVNPTSSPVVGCLLHGSATLGLVARVLWQHSSAESHPGLRPPYWLRRLQASFTQPVLMGEIINVQVWRLDDGNESTSIAAAAAAADHVPYAFRVVNEQGQIALDRGYAEVLATPSQVTSKL